MIDVVGESLFAIQVREQVLGSKPASDEEIRSICRELETPCRNSGIKIIINARPDLAFDGVHLGARSCHIEDARAALPNDSLIGYSAHSRDDLKQNADFFTYSPIFAPLSKEGNYKPCGLEGLAEAVRNTEKPVFALGGVTHKNAGLIRARGATGVACISSILAAKSPRAAALELQKAWFSQT